MNCLACLRKLDTDSIDGYHRKCLEKLFGRRKASPSLPFDKVHYFKADMLAQVTKKMSISGVQIKLSMRLQKGELAPVAENGDYILKPSPPEYPKIAENEHLSMLLLSLLGVNSPPLALVSFKDGELAYLVKRFDKSRRERLRKEDLCQIFGIPSEEKYSKSYEEAGLKILEATGGNLFCAYDFLKRVVFNFLIANGDFHLKNISLMRSSPEEAAPHALFDVLSPNYDSANTKIYLPDASELALNDGLLSGDFSQEYKTLGFYSHADFTLLGKRLGISDRSIEDIYKTIKRREKEMFTLVESSFLPEEMKSSYAGILRDQMKRLFTGLNF